MDKIQVRQFVEEQTSWKILAKLGSDRLLASSSAFFFLVPTAAKILSEVPSKIVIPLTDQELILHLQLPFSWVVLFIASFFMLAGNLVYSFACPSIIKDYDSYSDFIADGRSVTDLLKHLCSIVPAEYHPLLISMDNNETADARTKSVEYILGTYLNYQSNDKTKQEVIQGLHPKLEHSLVKQNASVVDQRPKAFSVIRDASSFSGEKARYATALCFLCAIGCFIYIVFKNLWYVLIYVATYGV